MPTTTPKPASRNTHQSGAEGLFLVCAELTRRGYIVSPTFRTPRAPTPW